MPIAKSAKRALRMSEKRRLKNIAAQKTLLYDLKHKKDLSQIQQIIDKAARQHLIHWKKASRLKSRLTKSH